MISYKNRMIVFIYSFLIIAGVLAGIAFYVMNTMSESIESIHKDFNVDLDHDRLLVGIERISQEARALLSKPSPEHRNVYKLLRSDVSAMMAQYISLKTNVKDMSDIVSQYRYFLGLTDLVYDARSDYGIEKKIELITLIDDAEDSLAQSLIAMHFEKMHKMSDKFIQGERVRSVTYLYTYGFVGFCLITIIFLLFYMRRAVEQPAMVIMEATERVSSGDLSYRINSHRVDEFGLLYRRFDYMVKSLEGSKVDLEDRLNLMQLLVALGALTSEGKPLQDVLNDVAHLVAENLGKDVFAIFVHESDTASYSLSACLQSTQAMQGVMRFVEDSSLVKRVVESKEPFVLLPDSHEADLSELTPGVARPACLIVAPALHDNEVLGFVLIGSNAVDGCSDNELNTARVLAGAVGAMIRNHTLHEETKSQLLQLSIIFELAKEISSLYDPDELLGTIASSVARLIHSRGCIIRLKQDDELVVSSVTGEDFQSLAGTSMPITVGVPGYVAREGESMLVEDVVTLPEDMKIQMHAKRSALVVPMIKEGVVLGTLGLVDKFDADGQLVSFTRADKRLAEGFASFSAMAIDKAMMHERGEMAQAEMVKTERRMELLFENVQAGIVTLGRDFVIKSANSYVERWADRPHADILMKDARDIFHSKDDNSSICPHCAAKATFEEGGVYSINMSKGLNYAELISYPVKDDDGNVTEAIVVIQDITDRVLYQEEIMGLYKEVMQGKEYIESIINNSADSIVTTDLKGMVKSWNSAAEDIYGYSKDEVISQFLPYVPEDQVEGELKNIESIKHGDVLKLDTFRKHSSGDDLEVSLTLSPIKDISGEIIGISHISRDITDRKRVEKELIRRNQELSRLFFISSAMRGTLDLDRLLYMVLVAVTMSDGLGFNRAVLFLLDEDGRNLHSTLGVGPASADEANRIWSDLSKEGRGLYEIMNEIEEGPFKPDSLLDKLSISISISLDSPYALAFSARNKQVCNINSKGCKISPDPEIIEKLGSSEYASVPLVSRGRLVGVLWVDNMFNQKPISEDDIKFLGGFADQVASAIEAARLFKKVSMAEAELENIFSSISDMVYFTDSDYTIRNVNQAVLDKLVMEKSQVIGKKCFQIFHGMDEPWHACPHHKTVTLRTPSVLELEDKHLGGTFITSTAPMFNSEREFMGTVHVVRDISELKDLRVKLQSAERKAALGEVAAKVAHEIRNPLVSVGGFAKRLEEKLDGSLKEYASIIAAESIRLESILKDILGFVREVRMQKKIIDLNDIAISVIGFLQDEFDRSHNHLVMHLEETPVMIDVDPDRVREAIMNMVVNANQAVTDGTVTVSTYREDHYAVFKIEDTGEGVDDEDRERIFDPFYTTRTMGTGLGLAVTKRIIEENEGHIELDIRPLGEGAVFKVYLPIEESAYEDSDS